MALGDPAGIGPEVTAKAWDLRETEHLPCFFAVGDVASIEAVWAGPIKRISDPLEAAAVFDGALPCMHVPDEGETVPGLPTLDGARCAFQSLEVATGLVRAESAAALITGPVSKTQLAEVGFQHPGQTEFIAERCGVSRSNIVLMLAGPTLRVVPLTIHIPFAQVPEALTAALIKSRAHATARGLRRLFGIEQPRARHGRAQSPCGRGRPARPRGNRCDRARAGGVAGGRARHQRAAFGRCHVQPPRARHYDVALCCYHDQALIPIKALHFDDGVHITLGLPIVRTSPDHGTCLRYCRPGSE